MTQDPDALPVVLHDLPSVGTLATYPVIGARPPSAGACHASLTDAPAEVVVTAAEMPTGGSGRTGVVYVMTAPAPGPS